MCISLCTGEAWVRGYNVAVAGLNFVKERHIYWIFIPLIILSTERAWKKLRRSWFAPPWSRNASSKRSTYQILARPYLHLTPWNARSSVPCVPLACRAVSRISLSVVQASSASRMHLVKQSQGSKQSGDKMDQDVSFGEEIRDSGFVRGGSLGIGYSNLTRSSKDIRNWCTVGFYHSSM